MAAVETRPIQWAQRVPCRARSQSPAPTFCPTKVVADTDRVSMGSVAKLSSLA